MAEDEVVGRVISGASWAQFCEALQAAGAEVLRPESPATKLTAPRAGATSRA